MNRIVTLLCLLSAVAFADGNIPTNTPGSTPVAITSMQAATTCVTSAAAAGSQAIVTVPAVNGQFFYVTHLEVSYSAIAAPAATLMATTTTNFGSFTLSQAMQAVVGENRVIYAFATPVKSAVAGTATVLTGNAGVTSISQSHKLCGFYAP